MLYRILTNVRLLRAYAVIALCAIAVWSVDNDLLAQEPIEIKTIEREEPVDFEREILPILRRSCLACHNATDAESDFVAESPAEMIQGGLQGPAIVPGKPDESLLLAVAAHQFEPMMPPADNDVGATPLSPSELGLVKLWIEQGAEGVISSSAPTIQWQPLPEGINPVYTVAVSADGQYAAAGRANQIFLYHIPSQRKLGRVTDPGLIESGLYKKPGVAHLDLVQSLTLSSDGQLLASGGFRTVKLWRRVQRQRLAEIVTEAAEARAFALSSDGTKAAVGSESGEIQLVDIAQKMSSATLRGHSDAITALAFSPDGHRLASTSADKSVRVWSIDDNRSLSSFPAPGEQSSAVWLGDRIATGGVDGVVRLWNLAQPDEPPAELKEHEKSVNSIQVADPKGTQLVTGSEDGTVRVWDVKIGKQLRSLKHGAPVIAVASSPEASRIASASKDGVVKIWNSSDGKEVATLQGDLQTQLQLQQRELEAGLAERHVTVARDDLKDAKELQKAEENNLKAAEEAVAKAEEEAKKKREATEKAVADQTAAEKSLSEQKAEIAEADEPDEAAQKKSKALEDELKKLAEATQKARDEQTTADRAVEGATRRLESAQAAVERMKAEVDKVEKVVKDMEQRQSEAQDDFEAAKEAAGKIEPEVRDLSFADDGRTLVSVGSRVQLWDVGSATVLDGWSYGEETATGGGFSPSQELVILLEDGTVVLAEGSPRWVLDKVLGSTEGESPFTDRVTALDFDSEAKLLAAGGGQPSRSGELQLWNVAEGKLLKSFPDAHSDTIFDVEFSPDDQLLATGAADRFARLFDVEAGEIVRTFEGHTHHVLSVGWRADGRVLATAGADKVVKVWDVRTGEQQRTIEGFNKEVTAVDFVALGSEIAVSSGDSSVSLKETSDGRNVRTFPGTEDFVYAVDVTADGKLLIAGGQDGTVRVWSADGKSVAVFQD